MKKTIVFLALLFTCQIAFCQYNEDNALEIHEAKPMEEASTNNDAVVNNDFIDENRLYTFEELTKKPKFRGNLGRWISKNLKYPPIAEDNAIQGTVVVQFVIEKDGSVTNVKIISGIDALDREAYRVIKSMPKWKPGRIKKKPVRVCCEIPILFRLN